MSGARIIGGDGTVEGPRGGEVRVVAATFRRHTGLCEQGVASGVAPVVSRSLMRRLVLLGGNGSQPRGTVDTVASDVMEDGTTHLPYGRRQLLDGLAADVVGMRVGPTDARV